MSWTPPIVLRGLVALVVGAWIVISPVLGQGFGVNTALLPAWHMYRSWGTGTLKVALYARTPQGDVPIRRLEVLGYRGWADAPRREKTLASEAAFRAQVRRVCDALPDTDVRADVDVAKIAGWRPIMRRQRDLCR